MTDPAAAPGDGPALEPEQTALHGCAVSTSCGQSVVHPAREQYVALMKGLVDDGYQLCVDLTAVDYVTHPGRSLPEGIAAERFEVVVSLLDIDEPRRIRVRVQVPEDDPVLPTLFDVWPGSEALEREVFDMFGIRFDGHPDLSRILMPEDWIGHPLRKDYEIGEIPVQFKAPGSSSSEEARS